MTGRFRKGRPYVVATVALPRLNLAGQVCCLLDTGADMSLLAPSDALRIGCRADDIPPVAAVGWDGDMNVGWEQAMVAFDDIVLKIYLINIGVVAAEPNPRHSMPSVIGRDLLDRWRIVWEPRKGTLDIELNHADLDDRRSNAVAHVIRTHAALQNGSGRLH